MMIWGMISCLTGITKESVAPMKRSLLTVVLTLM